MLVHNKWFTTGQQATALLRAYRWIHDNHSTPTLTLDAAYRSVLLLNSVKTLEGNTIDRTITSKREREQGRLDAHHQFEREINNVSRWITNHKWLSPTNLSKDSLSKKLRLSDAENTL